MRKAWKEGWLCGVFHATFVSLTAVEYSRDKGVVGGEEITLDHE